MNILIVFGILFLLSLAGIVALFIKKLPQMKLLNTDSLNALSSNKKKQDIMLRRMERASSTAFNKLNSKVISPGVAIFQDGFRRFAGRLTALERRMQEKKKRQEHIINPEALSEQIAEAKRFLDERKFDLAEKKLISIIGIDSRSISAYELLGKLYIEQRNYELAEETLRFLIKLAPDDASVNAYLGEVLEIQGKLQEAFEQYKKATNISQKNPKYLDFYISSAIKLDKTDEAREGLSKLRAVNPENSKIEQFEEAISASENKEG